MIYDIHQISIPLFSHLFFFVYNNFYDTKMQCLILIVSFNVYLFRIYERNAFYLFTISMLHININVRQVIFERRILLGCTAVVGVAVCIWSIAIGTDHWFTIESPDDSGLPLENAKKTGRRMLYRHIGLWKNCITGLEPELENSTNLIQYSKYFFFVRVNLAIYAFILKLF